MDSYDFKKIEVKWQKIWEKNNYGKAEDFSNKEKYYFLVEFPYPSGSGLHLGHCMSYGPPDSFVRAKRMQGFNVLFPMGWDAFGLPTENYAIANKVKPQEITKKSISTFKKQMQSLAFSFDWSREIDTTDPNYYKWTQWIFLQFYKHAIVDGKLITVDDDDPSTSRLAYQAEMPINWCPSCKIGLANEEVISGRCERCGTETTRKTQKQWMLRITAYADRLIYDLKNTDYLEQIKTQQINWIGKSLGANIQFKIDKTDDKIEVFTTRADTLFGCTYVVLSPEHEIISKIKNQISNIAEVEKYIEDASKKTDLDRTELLKEKSGVELIGISAINPINNEKIPVWVADYCMATYGTGAVMAVPGHDERDFEFAKKYNLPIKQVIVPKLIQSSEPAKYRPDQPTANGKSIIVFLKHPIEDKYLGLKWQENSWGAKTLLTGTIEDLAPEETIIKEIKEETGFTDFKIVKRLGVIDGLFYHLPKKTNKLVRGFVYLVELNSDKKVSISTEESARHKIHWLTYDELKNFLTPETHLFALDWLKNGYQPFIDDGAMMDSNKFDNLSSEEAKKKITEKIKEIGAGDFAINYKLRDWVFSRQHYWGEPIPIVHCEKDGTVPLDEKDLPLELPDVKNYEPSNTGESPLASISEWVNTTCPKCGGKAKRETDTMPNWAGSSWYYLRYCDISNEKSLADSKKLDYWLPVDLYYGGAEHTTLHLLYSRFWHKFLFDLKVVPGSEPYAKRVAHGLILGPDRQKMSKSRGNVINPDDIIKRFGADSLRTYIMFIGPYDQESVWSMNGLMGIYRFLNRVWKNQSKISNIIDSDELKIKLNQTIDGITRDLDNFHFNTVVSKLMELNNLAEKIGKFSQDYWNKFLILLYPCAPHLAEELWQLSKNKDLIENQSWPESDKKYLFSSKMTIVIQINGKMRDVIEVNVDSNQKEIEISTQTKKVKNILNNKKIKNIIYVPGKIINFVID